MYLKRIIAREISAMSRYYDRVLQWKPLPHDRGELLELVDCPEKRLLPEREPLPNLTHERSERTILLLNGTVNYHYDLERVFQETRGKLARTTRVVLIVYNSYYQPLYQLASSLKLRDGALPTTFLTRVELENLAKLASLEVVRIRPVAFSPERFAGLGDVANMAAPLTPLARTMSSSWIMVLRPRVAEFPKPAMSIVIPARNEKGNIEDAVKRLRYLKPTNPEIIFVEGHSKDGTWEEIQRVQSAYSSEFQIQALQQTGKGKNDAVRAGFAVAKRELLTILDADLTMPPELLHRFYDAYCAGLGDFVNGNRLTYPMENEAMRFLNRLGNAFFAKSLSTVLDASIGDALCGTKLVAAHDYRRFVRWREDFGDFDPFGDFELLFPAAILGLGIVEIPIRYRARTYGETQIQRFRHGLQLLNMTAVGLRKVKTGKV